MATTEITDTQIEALRAEAIEAGDEEMVLFCQLALEHGDANVREQCAEAIKAAQAQVTVYDYDTGDALDGAPSAELVRESGDESSGIGAVPAYRDAEGVWQYVQPADVEHYRRYLHEEVRTVYVD